MIRPQNAAPVDLVETNGQSWARMPSEVFMVNVRVSTTVLAERVQVWAELAQIEDHVAWMLDATAIRFLGDERSGVGARFECDTRFGPLRLTDLMEITEWEPEVAMGVRHRGAVNGMGRFSLSDAPELSTVIEWEEELAFPWWLGARLGALAAKPLFAAVWRGNLRRLSRRIVASPHRPDQGAGA
jgi:hypothetical protein